jgi:hypothetical protein
MDDKVLHRVGPCPLWSQGALRDFFAVWSPAAIEQLQRVNDPTCYRPAWYSFPPMENQSVAARGYFQTVIVIPAGSFLVGFIHQSISGVLFQFQITDLALDHSLISDPADDDLFQGTPYLFPDLYPVVAPGNFRCEVWNNSITEAATCEMILLVSEPI